jgi:two-component system chemotaxis response regulator CheY
MSGTSPLQQIRVLVIDDSSTIRTLLKEMLRHIGVGDTTAVGSGAEALRLVGIADPAYDLLVCDWNMDGMSGLQFLRLVREKQPNVPFLLISGRSDAQSIRAARAAGVSIYLRKPFSPRELEAKIHLALGARKAA